MCLFAPQSSSFLFPLFLLCLFSFCLHAYLSPKPLSFTNSLFWGHLVNKRCCQAWMQILGALESLENHKTQLQDGVISPWGLFSATGETLQPWIRESFPLAKRCPNPAPHFPSPGDASGPGAREQRGRHACTHGDAGLQAVLAWSPFSSH